MWVTVALGGTALALIAWELLHWRPPMPKNMPKPEPPNWLLGHLLHAASMGFQGRACELLWDWHRVLGRTYCFGVLRTNTVVTADPALIRQVLGNPSVFVLNTDLVSALNSVGNGLLALQGPTWQRHRKLMTPLFAPKELPAVHTATLRETDVLLAEWEDASARGEPIEVTRSLALFTLNVIGLVAYSQRFGKTEQDYNAVRSIFKGIDKRFHINKKLWPLVCDDVKELREANKHVRKIVASIVEKRTKGQVQKNLVGQTRDLLDILLLSDGTEAGSEEAMLSSQEIQDEIMTIYLAGHETTSNTLFACLYRLDMHPDIAQRLQAEVDQVCGRDPPRYEDMPRLKLLDAFIKETMRLHPTAHATSREVQHPAKLGDYELPADTKLILNFSQCNVDPEYWPDPEKFDLARWEGEESRDYYLPFGYGPKMCIGWRTAWAEMKCFMARLLQTHTVQLVPGQTIEFVTRITLSPKGSVYINPQPRQGVVV